MYFFHQRSEYYQVSKNIGKTKGCTILSEQYQNWQIVVLKVLTVYENVCQYVQPQLQWYKLALIILQYLDCHNKRNRSISVKFRLCALDKKMESVSILAIVSLETVTFLNHNANFWVCPCHSCTTLCFVCFQSLFPNSNYTFQPG